MTLKLKVLHNSGKVYERKGRGRKGRERKGRKKGREGEGGAPTVIFLYEENCGSLMRGGGGMGGKQIKVF